MFLLWRCFSLKADSFTYLCCWSWSARYNTFFTARTRRGDSNPQPQAEATDRPPAVLLPPALGFRAAEEKLRERAWRCVEAKSSATGGPRG
ncbi:hypothetical protein GN956_G23473 [Arapaima gigas]